MPPLADLLARLREATEGSQELDEAIHHAVGNPSLNLLEYSWGQLPAYSRILDAAMTLVPEGVFITLDRYSISDEPGPDPYAWRCWAKWEEGDFSTDNSKPLYHREAFSGTRPTPALALCIAALTARQEKPDDK